MHLDIGFITPITAQSGNLTFYEVTINQDVRTVHENESVYITIGSVHRLANPGKIPLELIEVQVGSYLGEDDIQRMEDVYGRS